MSKLITICRGISEATSADCVDNKGSADVAVLAPCKVEMDSDRTIGETDDDCCCDC